MDTKEPEKPLTELERRLEALKEELKRKDEQIHSMGEELFRLKPQGA